MLSALVSLMLFGMGPTPMEPPPARPLPGISIISVAPPSRIVAMDDALRLSASGVLLLDAESGEEIFSRAPDVRRPMASLTKVMTALLVIEHHAMDEWVTVPPIAATIHGSTVDLVAGERLTVSSLLRALLLPSANDAAYALATFHGHGLAAFVNMMNERARALGLTNTHFSNPAGLDSDQQYSTPRDLAWLTLAALKQETFRSIVGTKHAAISTVGGRVINLDNTNELLSSDDVAGVKTGTTDGAGECLIVLFRQGGRSYLLVLLGSNNRYTDGLRVMQALRLVPQS